MRSGALDEVAHNTREELNKAEAAQVPGSKTSDAAASSKASESAAADVADQSKASAALAAPKVRDPIKPPPSGPSDRFI